MGRRPKTPEQYRECFLSKCKKIEDGCWIFQGADKSRGYKEYKAEDKRYLAHRYSYIIHKGEIPEGMLILHSCDNPSCVNPEHLEVGNQSKNMKDMIKRHRRNIKGNNSPYHKLTSEQAEEIRQKYYYEDFTQKQLAKIYGVCITTISLISRHKRWS